MMFHRLMWTNFVHYILVIRPYICLSVLLIQRRILQTLLTLDNYRYQTHKWNITTFYLLIPKYHIIQLTKLQIDTLGEFKYHFSTSQNKFRLLLNKDVHLLVDFDRTTDCFVEQELNLSSLITSCFSPVRLLLLFIYNSIPVLCCSFFIRSRQGHMSLRYSLQISLK